MLYKNTCERSGEQICEMPYGEDLQEIAFLPADIRMESEKGATWTNQRNAIMIRKKTCETDMPERMASFHVQAPLSNRIDRIMLIG